MCLAFHTKHSKHEKSYNRVTTKWLQLNILGAERRKGGAPCLCRHAREGPLCRGKFVGPPQLQPSSPLGKPEPAGYLTAGGSPPGPLLCPASRAG